MDPQRDYNNYNRLSDIFNSFGVFNLVSTPTRGNNILDHIYAGQVLGHIVEDNTLSDHRSVLVDINFQYPNNTYYSINKRIFSNSNINAFSNNLKQESWEGVKECTNVNDAFNRFHEIFMFYFNSTFPLKTIKKHKNKNWVNPEIRNSSAHLKNLFKVKNKYPDLYREVKKKHSNLIRETKRKFYQSRVNKAPDPVKGAWSVVRELTGEDVRRKNGELLVNGTYVNNPQLIANTFNTFFKEAPLEVVNKIPVSAYQVQPHSEHVPHSLFLCGITEGELMSIVRSRIKDKKSAGYDEVSGSLIRKVIEPLAGVLSYIINLSFVQGKFPEALKINKIIPILKKGDDRLVENYRPVSLIPVFSKVLEYAFLSRLEPFLEKNNILTSCQFGFRRNCSTMSAIQHFYTKIVEHMERGECPAGIFCDLSRAFDCVNHQILLEKIEGYGIRGSALSWLESFISDRRQFVSVSHYDSIHGDKAFASDVMAINLGVPQGSILGPILFILYINDLAAAVDPGWTVALFADDSSFVVSSSDSGDLERICNSGMKTVLEWFNSNFLYLNSSKTTYIRFHTHQNKRDQDLNLSAGNQGIVRSTSTKFLGLTIDQNLNWKEHCNGLSKKLNSLCYMIRNLKSVLAFRDLLTVYHAYVGSRLHYGICFWGLSSSARDIFVAQKRALRCIIGLSQDTSCRSHFASNGLLTLTGIFIYEISKFIHLNKSGILHNRDVHEYNTRGRNNLQTLVSRLDISKNAPNNYGRLIYNKLPQYVKKNTYINAFKKHLKLYLVRCEHYSIDEYLN